MNLPLALQQVLVAVLVPVCTAMAVWRLAPVRVRLRWLDWLDRRAALPGGKWRARLRQRALRQFSDPCGGCSRPPAMQRNQTPDAPRR